MLVILVFWEVLCLFGLKRFFWKVRRRERFLVILLIDLETVFRFVISVVVSS